MKRREFISLVAGALVRSRAAPAQQPTKVYRIAIVHPSRPVSQMTETDPYWRPLFQELRLLGYVEGQNLVVERYSGEGREQNYARLAHEVVHLKPDLIFANSDRMMGHFKAATTTIPIVGLMADPVSSGLVAGLANRGGNITGSRRWLRDLDQAARNAPSGYPKPNDSGLPRFPWGLTAWGDSHARGSSTIGDFTHRSIT